MRIAIFSDVHGNTIALDAVLADIEAAGVDACWFLGDACSQGYDPAGCALRLSALPHLRVVRGNTDHHSTADTHAIDEDFVEWAGDHLAEAQHDVAIMCNFYWTRGASVRACANRCPCHVSVRADLSPTGHEMQHSGPRRLSSALPSGASSNPATSDHRAMWTLLDADEHGYRLERRFASYDIDAMLAALADARQPVEAYIRRFWGNHE